jgi:peptidoglycan/xylan/chitin deacetylase (PgdA/CDA1 family)
MIRSVQSLGLASIWMLLLFGSLLSGIGVAEQTGLSPVYVIIWFDTEDYILPPSDDAAKRLADFLTAEGVQATFKVVGEKARTLERRGRKDVIASLRDHDIGYHSNTHSQHPTPAEYESVLDWNTGVEEFTRRERQGFEDVLRIFGKTPCCYGQPGNSWAPQSFDALRRWGVRLYLDEGSHVGLDGKPFWYGGLLNIFNTVEGQELRPNDNWDNLERSKVKFRQFYARISSEQHGGLISLYFHPCEFIHQWFWDMNFAHGANPPREQWKEPAQKSSAQQKQTFRYFEDLVRYMKTFPNVRFITGSQALDLYPDLARKRDFSSSDLAAIAKEVTSKVSFQEHGDYALSASEILELLSSYVAKATLTDSDVTAVRLSQTPYGPSSASPPLEKALKVSLGQFLSTVLDIRDFVTIHHQVPEAVWLGSIHVPPEAYLVALADISTRLLTARDLPRTVTIAPAQLVATEHIATDSVKLWDWPIFPEGFHSARLMEFARLQAWTLKPAILVSPPASLLPDRSSE